MSDFRTLHEAFDELARQADNAPSTESTPPRTHSHVALIAASVVAVLAVAAAAVLLARPSHGSHTQAGTAPSEAPLSAAQPAPVTQPATQPVSKPAVEPTSTPPPAAHQFRIPQTAKDLSDRFQAVLGDEATFKVTLGEDAGSTNTGGAYIVGTLTTSSGASGGFDLQIISAGKGAKAMCDDPDRATCKITHQPDGASLAVGSEPLQTVPGGVTNQADLIWRNGTEFLMHVSNARDPKGDSALMGEHPPLTTDEMTKIVTSDRW